MKDKSQREILDETIQVRIPKRVKAAIESKVASLYKHNAQRVTVSSYVLQILEKWMKEKKR